MTDVQERKRGRSRSPLRDNGMRATKLLKPDIGDSQGDPQTLKRVRSNSVKDLDPRSKKIRDVSSGFGLGFNSSTLVDKVTGLLTPLDGPSVEFEGCLIYNPHFATYGADGTLTPLSKESLRSLTGPKASPPAMLTPQATPKGPRNDPFEKLPSSWDSQNSKPPIDKSHLVIIGDINAFGLLPGKIEIHKNVNRQQPYSEIFRPKISTFSLGTFFPSMKGQSLDAIELQNVNMSYMAFPVDALDSAGVYLHSDVIFTGALQSISDFLKDYFGQKHPSLHFSTYLGGVRDWNSFPSVRQLTLKGSIENMSAKVFDVLEFTRVGVELLMDASVDHSTKTTKWDFGYGFFGDVNVRMPGSVVPLQCHYHLRKIQSTYLLAITLRNDEWKDVFGIQGLNLSGVYLEAIVATGGKDTRFDFKIEAEMQWHQTAIAVGGSYGSDGYSLTAYIGDLSLQDVGELFQQMMGAELDVFDHDVVLNSMYLNISNQGFVLSGSITINGHSSASGKLELNRDGINISGGIKDMSFEGIDIHKAELDVFIGTKSQKKSTRETRVAIMGDVSFQNIDLQVGVYIRKPGDGKPLEWAIYGEAKGDLSTSRLCSDLKGTFLDISLTGVALMAANHESSGGSYNTHGYPMVNGIQFCAMVKSIPALEDLVGGSIEGTILTAAYTKGAFSLSLTLPAKRTITFSPHVYTGPLKLSIQAGKDIKIALEAELNVKLSDQPHPLKFALGLKAGALDASAYGQMLTDWVNPCGVGKQITIRGCALEVGVVYTTFAATGMPGKIGIAGQILIGEKEAKAAMMLSQNPSEQLLAASIKDMGVTDLVKFASLILEKDLPQPGNFLYFNEFDLYISTGTTVGVTYYPPGASLKGDMIILGKKAKFDCRFEQGVKIMATIEPFSIGPLKVSGAKDAKPIVDVELSSSAQKVYIDGAVSIWGASASIHLDANFYPSPKFDFELELQLCDLLLIQFEAKLTGKIDFKNLKTLENADFNVHGLVEQRMVQYITEQVEAQINSAQRALDEDFDKIKDELAAEEREFQEGCQNALKKLEAARVVWHQKRDAIKNAFDSATQDLEVTRRNLQRKVDEAEAVWKVACQAAKQEFENAQNRSSATIREAEAEANRAQQDNDREVLAAKNELQRTKDVFYRQFGNAKRDVENKRRDVEDVERRVESLQQDINWKRQEYDRSSGLACWRIGAEITAIEATKATAQLPLRGLRELLLSAEQVIEGTSYATAEGAIRAAQSALNTVSETKALALEIAKAALKETEKTQATAVQVANEAIKTAEEASEELDMLNKAREALDEGCKLAQGVVDAAKAAVDQLANCTEFLAFDVAEKALTYAKENTKKLNLARHAVNLAEEASHLGLDIAKWASNHLGKLIDIQRLEFKGSLKSLIADGPPLRVEIEGILCGDKFAFELVWKPHFNLVAFIKALFNRLWEIIKGAAKSVQAWANDKETSDVPIEEVNPQDKVKAPKTATLASTAGRNAERSDLSKVN